MTGPTGSGKTTTLYSALGEVNDVETKILTAEDPVEYEIEGIMQVAVNHQVGLDFLAHCVLSCGKIQIRSWWGKFAIWKPHK